MSSTVEVTIDDEAITTLVNTVNYNVMRSKTARKIGSALGQKRLCF